MLTSSQKLLLQCLSDFLERRPTTLKEPADRFTDWKDLFSIACAQSLDAILFYQCSAFIPTNVKRGQIKRYLGHAVISFEREEMIRKLTERTEDNSISFVYIKGSVFRDYYPQPPLRNMGDIDLLIHPEDRNTVDHILRDELGFQRFIDNQEVWTYWKGNQYVELHTRIFYDPLANSIDYRSYFERVWDNCRNSPVFGISSDRIFIPNEELHFLYLMAHTAKHIVNNGSGFRAYLDMVLMCRACNDKLDWERITKELERLELLDFTKTCFRLCERWFGVKMPLPGDALDEKFINAATEKTFMDGIFGLENRINKRADAARDIKRSGGYYYLGAVRRVIKKLFPPYQDMQLVEWYSFVDGRPWLMPAAWIYRWFYCAVKKTKHSIALLTEPFVRKREVVEREDYLKQWGL